MQDFIFFVSDKKREVGNKKKEKKIKGGDKENNSKVRNKIASK